MPYPSKLIAVPSKGRFVYTPTTKTEDVFNAGVITGTKESAYGWLSRTMMDQYGDTPVTAMDVYDDITKPRGLNFMTTEQLLDHASKAGFLRRGLPR